MDQADKEEEAKEGEEETKAAEGNEEEAEMAE